MSNCTDIMQIHKVADTQDNRFLPALDPSYFLIDERSEMDYMLFLQKLAKLLSYYNVQNIKEGDWAPFVEWESTSVLVVIAKWDIAKYQQKIETAANAGVADLKVVINELQLDCTNIVRKIESLDYTISTKEKLLAFEAQVKSFNDAIPEVSDPEIEFIKPAFMRSVKLLLAGMQNCSQIAASALTFHLENYSKHSPHYALLLAFLQMVNVVQKDVNTFTERHLKFYYNKVLRLARAGAQPDFVHFLVEPRSKDAFLLPEGTRLLAGKNELGEAKYYHTLYDQVFNNIKLKEVQSVFVDDDLNLKKSIHTPKIEENEPITILNSETDDVEQGMLIAGPLFYLRGGLRVIKLYFAGEMPDPKLLDFYITAESKWLEITSKVKVDSKEQCIMLTILASEKPIIPYSEKVHKSGYAIEHPVLKIISSTKKSFTLKSIQASVSELKDFVLSTDLTPVDITKPFQPFGPIPKSGNGFVFGCKEIFQKKNVDVRFEVLLDDESKKSELANVLVKELKDGNWQDADINQACIEGGKIYLKERIDIDYNEDEPINNTDKHGFIRVQLDNSMYEEKSYMQQYLIAAKAGAALPYVPTIQSITASYFSTYQILDKDLDIYTLDPFGYSSINSGRFTPISKEKYEADLYIGLESVLPGNALSLLFQFNNGSANPLKPQPEIKWQYLTDNHWTDFSTQLNDHTEGLSESGIANVSLPATFTLKNNTKLSPELFWIKIHISDAEAINQIAGIHTQAVNAVLSDDTNFDIITDKETISKLESPLKKVSKIIQPYASFGGKQTEDEQTFYTNASELLRHKDRAINKYDYEHIILKEFPALHMAKCLTHFKIADNATVERAPGYVTIVPIAKNVNTDLKIDWRPMVNLSMRNKIKTLVQSKSSPHARIAVQLPILEKISFSFRVRFRQVEGGDDQYFYTELISRLNQWIAPWAYANDEKINFSKGIEMSAIISKLDHLGFVDFVDNFTATVQMSKKGIGNATKKFEIISSIEPRTPISLFVPLDHHITILKSDECNE